MHSFFDYLPVEKHVSCFQFLAVLNKASVNICVQVFGWPKVFIFLG